MRGAPVQLEAAIAEELCVQRLVHINVQLVDEVRCFSCCGMIQRSQWSVQHSALPRRDGGDLGMADCAMAGSGVRVQTPIRPPPGVVAERPLKLELPLRGPHPLSLKAPFFSPAVQLDVGAEG